MSSLFSAERDTNPCKVPGHLPGALVSSGCHRKGHWAGGLSRKDLFSQCSGLLALTTKVQQVGPGQHSLPAWQRVPMSCLCAWTEGRGQEKRKQTGGRKTRSGKNRQFLPVSVRVLTGWVRSSHTPKILSLKVLSPNTVTRVRAFYKGF